MKLRIASDLHVEFYHYSGWADLLEEFPGDEADALVLAGDVVPLQFLDVAAGTFRPFCERYKHVVYVPGNHEYYGTNPITANLVLSAVEDGLTNLVVLRNSTRTLDGQKFYGGTMWFPNLPNNWKYKGEFNDFYAIQKFEPWVYNQERDFREGLRRRSGRDTVVVSHHLPSMGSCAPRYRTAGLDNLNAFFVDPMDDLIKIFQPKLWIHGHTHIGCDWSLDATRIVCNPYGYPHEMADFPPRLVVEV